MFKRLNSLVLVALCSITISACGGDGVVVSTESAKSMLLTQMKAIQSASTPEKGAELAEDLILPNPKSWFSDHFGSEKSRIFAAEYKILLTRSGGAQGIAKSIMKTLKKGRTDITVELVNENNATGHQKTALAKAKKPIKLYSVRFVAPGKGRGFHLWSFIHDGHGMRFIGRLKALSVK